MSQLSSEVNHININITCSPDKRNSKPPPLFIPVNLFPKTFVKTSIKQCHIIQDSDETQEHLLLCERTRFERRGLDLFDWRGLLDFWRRMKFKMAAVT